MDRLRRRIYAMEHIAYTSGKVNELNLQVLLTRINLEKIMLSEKK